MIHRAEGDRRKQEFLDTALELFSQQGYEKTTIQHIIDAMGVSKGAFYHYFQSKEDLVEQTAAAYADRVVLMAVEIAAMPDLDALQKLNRAFQLVQGYKKGKQRHRMKLRQAFREGDNLRLQKEILTRLQARVLVPLRQVIDQGVREGLFQVSDAGEAAEFLLYANQGLSASLDQLAARAREDPNAGRAWLKERLESKLTSYEEMLERALALPKGSLDLRPHYMERFLELYDEGEL